VTESVIDMFDGRSNHIRHSICKSRDHEHLLADFDSKLVDEVDRQAHHSGLDANRDRKDGSPSIYLL
jgi:hypothetical protein